MTDDAPRWLVRWLKILGLLAVIGVEVYGLYQEWTWPDRMEAQLHALNCQFALDASPNLAARIVCLPDR